MKVRNPDKLIEALKGINEFMDDNGLNAKEWILNKSPKVRLAATYLRQMKENAEILKGMIDYIKSTRSKP